LERLGKPFTFAASVRFPVNDTPPQPTSTDAIDRLELIHERMKTEQEAWRRLLERLEEAERTRTEQPTPPEQKP
jgi:hypothetical protein